MKTIYIAVSFLLCVGKKKTLKLNIKAISYYLLINNN